MAAPVDEFETIKLVSINSAHSATIKVLKSGNILTAKSNGFFKGSDFGNYGLLLFSVSKELVQLNRQKGHPSNGPKSSLHFSVGAALAAHEFMLFG